MKTTIKTVNNNKQSGKQNNARHKARQKAKQHYAPTSPTHPSTLCARELLRSIAHRSPSILAPLSCLSQLPLSHSIAYFLLPSWAFFLFLLASQTPRRSLLACSSPRPQHCRRCCANLLVGPGSNAHPSPAGLGNQYVMDRRSGIHSIRPLAHSPTHPLLLLRSSQPLRTCLRLCPAHLASWTMAKPLPSHRHRHCCRRRCCCRCLVESRLLHEIDKLSTRSRLHDSPLFPTLDLTQKKS